MTFFARHLIALGVFLAAGSLSYFLWQQETRHTELARRLDLDTALREVTQNIEQRLRSDEQLLRSVQGLLHLPGDPGREVIEQFVTTLQLDANFAGLEGIGIADLVPAAQLDAHVAAQRRLGLGTYQLRPEPLSQPRQPGAAARDLFAPVVQIEPRSARNQRWVGNDLHADPVLRVAMQTSRDSGLPAISGRIELASADGAPPQPGFVMFLPVFTDGSQPQSVAARQAAIVTWIIAPIRVHELVASIHGEWARGNDIRLYDGVQMTPETLLFDSVGTARTGDGLAGWTAEYLVVGGRSWALALRPKGAKAGGAGQQASRIIAAAGLALSLLLGLFTWVLLTGRARLRRTATRMTAELREAKNHFELIFNTSPDGVLITRRDNREIMSVNAGFCRMTGYPRAELVGQALDSLQLWKDPQEQQRVIDALAQQGSCDNMEAVLQTRRGTTFIGIVSARSASFGGNSCFVAVVRDISARKQAELQLAHLAQHDPLTRLPNRTLLADRLQQAIARSKRDRHRLSLMFLDLDRFKPVNDTLGHAYGDLLLQAAALRILECVRETDTVARIGGDEFLVLLPLINDAQDALLVAEKIRSALGRPFDLDGGHRVLVSSSAGIAIYPDDAVDEAQLQKNADLAMYQAKSLGGNRVALFGSVDAKA